MGSHPEGTEASVVTQEQTDQYRTQGYCVVERCLSAEDLESLRAECARFIREIETEMDAGGVDWT